MKHTFILALLSLFSFGVQAQEFDAKTWNDFTTTNQPEFMSQDFLAELGDGNFGGIAYIKKDCISQCNGAAAFNVTNIKTSGFGEPNMKMIGVKTNHEKTMWAFVLLEDLVTDSPQHCDVDLSGNQYALGLVNGKGTTFYYEISRQNDN